MRKLIVPAALLLLSFGCGTEKEVPQGRRTVLEIGTHAAYPPFESVNDSTGRPEGFDIDMITEICILNGWKPQFVITSFDSLIHDLIIGKYDVVVSAMTITPQRAAIVDFSDAYFQTGQIIAVPIEDSTITSIDDLVGKRVGVQTGTTGESMAKNMDGLQVYSFEDISTAFVDMAEGNLDAVLNDFPSTNVYIAKNGTAKTVGDVLSIERYGMAVRKGDEKLLGDINKSLKILKGSERFIEIHLKWFGVPPSEHVSTDTSVSEE
jgi:polar amino acid transport system substrate-binding protein